MKGVFAMLDVMLNLNDWPEATETPAGAGDGAPEGTYKERLAEGVPGGGFPLTVTDDEAVWPEAFAAV